MLSVYVNVKYSYLLKTKRNLKEKSKGIYQSEKPSPSYLNR